MQKTFVNNIQKTLYVIVDSNEIEIKAKNKLKMQVTIAYKTKHNRSKLKETYITTNINI